MPHEAVEVEWRGRAGIGIDGGHFLHGAGNGRGVGQDPGGILEGGARRQVQHDLQLGLVVERQQFDRDRLSREHRAGKQRRDADAGKELPGRGSRGDYPPGDTAIELAQTSARGVMGLVMSMPGDRLAGEADHQPRRQDHGDEEREQHGRRRIHRYRRHVGAHQAGHEQHGQQRRHHGQGGDHGGIADLGHRLDGALDPAAAIVHRPVPGDVLDHHDGVVDEDADGEDQGEQADPIHRVAHQLGREESQQDGGRDDHGGDRGFPPADSEADQDDDRDGCEGQMEQQFIGLLVGGLPVVAGHRHVDAGGDQRALERLDALHQGLADHHGVGAPPLGDGQADRRRRGPAVPCEGGADHVGLVFAGGLDHPGDVAHIDGPAGDGGDGDQPDLGGAAETAAGGHLHRVTVIAQHAAGEAAPGLTNRVGERGEGDAAAGHATGVRLDPHLLRATTDDEGQAHIVDLGQFGTQLHGKVMQRLVRPASGGARCR